MKSKGGYLAMFVGMMRSFGVLNVPEIIANFVGIQLVTMSTLILMKYGRIDCQITSLNTIPMMK
jgi:hypothetical protein